MHGLSPGIVYWAWRQARREPEEIFDRDIQQEKRRPDGWDAFE
jgi:hypothetical protein